MSGVVKTNLKKISIIVPIYNAERYLNKCLDSILNQSYENIEVLLINDGSTDNSKRIIQEYAKMDKRILEFHKENGGIGSTYKVAIKNLTGEFISFVDSDDYIHLDMYKEIVEKIEECNPDIVQFGFFRVNEEGQIFATENIGNKEYTNSKTLFTEFYQKRIHPGLGLRVFKRELLESAESLDQNIGIDELLISQAILKCNKLVNIDKSFYYILERQGSVSRAVVTEKIAQQGMLVHKLICELVEDTEPTLIMYPREKYLSYLLFLFFNLEHSENIVDLKTSIIKEFKENYKVVKVNGYWSSKKLRILSLGFNFNPFLFEKIYKLIK